MAPTKNIKDTVSKLRYEMALCNLDTIFNLADTIPSLPQDVTMFRLRYADLETEYKTFVELHLEIMATMSSEEFDVDAHKARYLIYNDRYYRAKAVYSQLFPTDSDNSRHDVSVVTEPKSNKKAFLPRLQLPSFTGKIEEFASFMDIFESIVGSDTTLSDTEKLYYLVGTLSGEPKTLIQHLSIVGDNFHIAVELLKRRYANKRLMADKLLHNMLSIGSVNKSLGSLRRFLNVLLESTKALEKMDFPVYEWSYLLLFINLQNLDHNLKKNFEEKVANKELPEFSDLISFLENEVRILECSGTPSSSERVRPPAKSDQRFNKSRVALQATTEAVCAYCNQRNHHIQDCDRFLCLQVRHRKRHVINHKLCFRCLGGHPIYKCSTGSVCSMCASDKHHTLLHYTTTGSEPRQAVQTLVTQPNDASGRPAATAPVVQSVLHAATPVMCRRTVLLATAMVQVKDGYGRFQTLRALLDGGSQSTFISEECAQRLHLQRFRSTVSLVTGLSGNPVSNTNGSVMLSLRPVHAAEPVLLTQGLVLGKITDNLPSFSFSSSLRKRFGDIFLADSKFYASNRIDLLIGADLLGNILLGNIIKFGDDLPSAINTIFGYVLMGPITFTMSDINSNCETYFTQTFVSTLDTNRILEKFWEVEELNEDIVDPKDLECETLFLNTHSRNASGRYTVRLPFLSHRKRLGDSGGLALKRFYAMERRINRDNVFRNKYVDFMKEYIELGHMSVCKFSSVTELKEDSYYVIPHHGIFKSGSDKIRVVFDASCRTSTGVALNDCLHSGPKLQRDIMEIICRFRLHRFVFTSDIRMMFRQLAVHEDDKMYQLIYWRESPDRPVRLYKLNTVTYGMKCSPYLAIRVLRQLADDGAHEYPAAARLLRSSVYMDDVLGGADNLDEAKALVMELTKLLLSGGFELRKWVSNNRELMSDIPEEYQEKPHIFDSDQTAGSNFIKILGVQWDPTVDSFTYHTNLPRQEICSKRVILSSLARTFDPLGWITPIIFQGKILMQRLWSLKLDWDDEPPNDIVESWNNVIRDFSAIERIKLERCVLPSGVVGCTLHGFSDASELGYGAAVYMRAKDLDGNIMTSLMMAKSRVAPVKSRLTIPKLELCGAALLIKVLKYVVTSIKDNIDIQELVCWSDSTIVLSWLRMEPHLLQTFEGNRVSQIVNCGLDISWRHVPTDMNPADVASRGCSAVELNTHSLWWGPHWLRDEGLWPLNLVPSLDNNEVPGLRKHPVLSHAATILYDDCIINRFSSFSVLLSVVAYCLRFCNNAKDRSKRITGILSVNERNLALNTIIKCVQSRTFSNDLEALKFNQRCSDRFRRLMPFIGDDGLIRVGGRLKNSDLPFETRHPILLPKSDHFTNLVIDYFHKTHCHTGPTALQAILQRKFWILSARQIIRHRIFKCMHCFRLRATPSQPIMSDLPSDRVTSDFLFSSVQTDFAGPFMIKTSALRNAKLLKAYLCVFVCSASKAVHLEVVSDLSTEGFLSALTRFTSRRGMPRIIRSDNGTNYIGTNRHLNEVQKFLTAKAAQNNISEEASKRGITWLFNPPSAPHFGGLFEAAVKSAKTLLYRVIGDQTLTYEEISTMFTRIEAVLNSRPLCPLSPDVENFDVLTPAHLLIGRSLTSVPEYDWDGVPDNRLSKFQRIQAMSQRFWKKWSEQYLVTLQQRNKWTSKTSSLSVGELVLIKDDIMSPLKWKMGRVSEVLPGKDGVVRVVSLKTASGKLTRPVVKLCRLPTEA